MPCTNISNPYSFTHLSHDLLHHKTMHWYIIHLPWTSTVLLELTIESLLQSYNNIYISLLLHKQTGNNQIIIWYKL